MKRLMRHGGKRGVALLVILFLLVTLSVIFGTGAWSVAGTKADSAPAQPSGLRVEAENHSATLTWNENVTDDDLLLYVLEYKCTGDTWQSLTIHDATATTCTVDGLTNYERYQFRLKVQDSDLNWSEYSEMVFATPADATLADLRVDGATVAGFSPNALTYHVPLPSGATVIPVVTATANDPAATVVVTDATGLPGSATVLVTAPTTKKGPKDGPVQRTYTVHFAIPFTVSFDSNGGGDVEPIQVYSGQALGVLPIPNKPGSIFIRWCTDDDSFEHAVSENTIVTSDLTLYAQYSVFEGVQETDEDLFVGAMDCPPDFAIVIQSDSPMTTEAVKEALQLEVLDSTPLPELSVSGGGGVYTVAAAEGYTPGSSYKLTLTDTALSFGTQPDGTQPPASARTYCFTIFKPVVMNVRLDPGVTVIPAEMIDDITVGGVQAIGLSAPLASVGDISQIGDTGTFTYDGPLAVGDVLAIYMGAPLDERVPTEDYSDDAVAYVEVIAIDGSTVTYRTAEAQEVLFTPDILPVDPADDVDGVADDNALTIAVSDMTYTGDVFAEMGLDANTVVEAGDFLAFYGGGFGEGAALIKYGLIETVELSGANYLITYFDDVPAEDVQAAMDLSTSYDKSYEGALSSAEVLAMEADIERQAMESGFVDAAAAYLTDLALKTDGFQKQLDNAALLSQATDESSWEVIKKDWSADIYFNLGHWPGLSGIGCEVTVEFVVAYDDSMTIELTGTFVQELRTSLSASGGAVWKKKWIFPYIADYRMNASLDVYNFTSIDIGATITTGGSEFDIEQEIEELMNAQDYQSEEASAKAQDFYDRYTDMLANEHDYVELFKKENIIDKESSIDPYHILVCGFELDFVVSADVNLSLGCYFEYEKATRYTFSMLLFAGKATSNQLDLVDEHYKFEFWVMGTVGLRAGVVLRIELGLFTLSAGSIGIEVEVGPYIRMWGYFYYLLDSALSPPSRTSGALYFELGIYLEIRFLAQAVGGKYSYNPTLYEHEWPLWHAGSQYNVFDFSYTLTDSTDDIYLKGDNTSYALPPPTFSMKRLDLKQGGETVVPYSSTSFTTTFTDESFSEENGTITVEPLPGQHLVESDMTICWGGAPLSFTSVPISRTYHVVWDDLGDSYVISFDSQGGSLVAAIIGASGSPVTLPEPTREGYIFDGWYYDQAGSADPYTATTMPAQNVHLYAKWEAEPEVPYTVRHYQQTVAGSEYELVAAETFTGVAGAEVKPDVKSYTGFSAPEARAVVIDGNGSTAVEYKYDRNSYSLIFMPETGGDAIERTVAYGANIAPPQLTWPGYAFDAWYREADLSTVYTFSPETTMPAEPLTLYAGWTLTSLLAEINTHPSSRFDGIALVGDLVHDTITLTWDAPPGTVPTGSVVVTMRTPGGVDSVIYNQVIAATSSPLVITTEDQYLGELGLYQFQAVYIPDAASVFAGAVSHFYEEPVVVTVLESLDAPQYAPGAALPASPVVGTLEGPYWEAADFRDWYDVSLSEGDRLTIWVTGWTGPSPMEMWIWVLGPDGELADGGTFPSFGNPDQPYSYGVPAGGAGVYSLLVETVNGGGMYAFEYMITPAVGP